MCIQKELILEQMSATENVVDVFNDFFVKSLKINSPIGFKIHQIIKNYINNDDDDDKLYCKLNALFLLNKDDFLISSTIIVKMMNLLDSYYGNNFNIYSNCVESYLKTKNVNISDLNIQINFIGFNEMVKHRNSQRPKY